MSTSLIYRRLSCVSPTIAARVLIPSRHLQQRVSSGDGAGTGCTTSSTTLTSLSSSTTGSSSSEWRRRPFSTISTFLRAAQNHSDADENNHDNDSYTTAWYQYAASSTGPLQHLRAEAWKPEDELEQYATAWQQVALGGRATAAAAAAAAKKSIAPGDELF